MRRFRFITLTIVTLLLAGCAREAFGPETTLQEQGRNVLIRFDFAQATRSAAFTDEQCSSISSVQVLAYRDGRFAASAYTGGTAMTEAGVYLMAGYTYNFYLLANAEQIPDASIPADERSLADVRVQLAQDGALMPMSGSVTDVAVKGGRSQRVGVVLERMMARVRLKLDASALPGLRITSVQLKQAAADYTPWAERSAAVSAFDYDSATASDLSLLNSGGSASFYVLENCRGTLLPGNTDHWAKIPESIGSDPLCTYIEVGAVFEGNAKYSGEVTYRLYLGQDATTNFDIIRNQDMLVSMRLSEDGLQSGIDWKVDVSGLDTGEDPEYPEGDLYMAQKGMVKAGSASFGAFTLDTGQSADVHENGILRVYKQGRDLVYDAIGPGSATISIEVTDALGRSEIKDVPITVYAPVLSLGDTAPVYLHPDGRASASRTLTYLDNDGQPMDRSAFDPLLYAQLLEPSLDTEVLESCFEIDAELSAWLSDIPDTLGDEALVARLSAAAPSAAISPVTLEFYTADPYPAGGSFTVDERSLISMADTPWSIPVGNIEGYDPETMAVSLGYDGDICSVSYSAGSVSVLWPLASRDDSRLPKAVETLHGTVVNRHSARSWTSPSEWKLDVSVHLCVGGEVFFMGGSRTNPLNYGVRAVWGHDSVHDDMESPLVDIEFNLVAARADAGGYYPTGLYAQLYRLSRETGYPSGPDDDAWYGANQPEFDIVQIDQDNEAHPVPAGLPYTIIHDGYRLVIHHYIEISPGSGGWLGR